MKTYKLHLSPYGSFEHPEGLQTISSADARHCIRQTCTLKFRLGLKKIPVYIGHPDDPLFRNGDSDARVCGYVKNLCADENGLWVFVKWTKDGRAFLSKSPQQYLSPRWVLCKKETQTAYHPEILLSVGLTQHPNLPVQPVVFDALPKTSFGLCRLLRALTKYRASSETPHPQTGGIRPDDRLRRIFVAFIGRIRRMFVKKVEPTAPVAEPQRPAQLPTPDKGTRSDRRTPLSSDLRGTQTREEKRRILQFGQAVRERMKATGESYPEAWNALLRQTPASPLSLYPNATKDDGPEPPAARPKRSNFVPRSLKPITVTEHS